MKDPLANLDIKKGCQEADGKTALGYSRSRTRPALGDIDRAAAPARGRLRHRQQGDVAVDLHQPGALLQPLDELGARPSRSATAPARSHWAGSRFAMTRVDGENGPDLRRPHQRPRGQLGLRARARALQAIIEDDTTSIPKQPVHAERTSEVTYETLTVDTDGDGVTLLTLSRPEAMNSFTVTMARELEAFFLAAAADDAIRAIVVTGDGQGVLCGHGPLGRGQRLRPRRVRLPHARGRCGSTSPRSPSSPASATPAAR